MTGLEQGLPGWLVVAVLAAVVLGAGVGAVLRAVVLARVAASPRALVRDLGSAWVNAPAAAVAAAVLVWQTRLDLLPGTAPAAVAVAVVGVIGLCGGLSTWSTLSLELARAVLAGDRRLLLRHGVGVVLGVLAGVFGAGVAVLAVLLLG